MGRESQFGIDFGYSLYSEEFPTGTLKSDYNGGGHK